MKKQKFVCQNFLPSLHPFSGPRKSPTATVSQGLIKNTFLYNMSRKQLCQKHHNKIRHHLLFCNKKFILHEYCILFQLINIKNICLDYKTCLSKITSHVIPYIMHNIIASYRLNTCFIIFYICIFTSDFPFHNLQF